MKRSINDIQGGPKSKRLDMHLVITSSDILEILSVSKSALIPATADVIECYECLPQTASWTSTLTQLRPTTDKRHRPRHIKTCKNTF